METRKTSAAAFWRSAALTALALAIVACSHHHNNGSTTTNNMMNNTTTPAVDQFGAGFGNDFDASPNSTPANVSSNDVIATDPTAQPSSLNNIGD
jgi:hypothetical protein